MKASTAIVTMVISCRSARTIKREQALQHRLATGREIGLTWLTLLTSAGTLVCCALPVLLVSLAFGAALASMTSSMPWLVELSRHKEWIFAGSFLMLLVSGWFISGPGRNCPADPELARACARINTVNRRILRGSITIWVIGFFAAFLLLPLSEWVSR